MSEWINEVGYLKINKNGKRLLEFRKDVDLKFKNSIRLQNYKESMEQLFAKKIITKEVLEDRLKKSVEHGGDIGYVMNVPPQTTKGKEPSTPAAAKGWKRKALEVRQNDEHIPYVMLRFDVSLKSGDTIWLDNFEESIKEKSKMSPEDQDSFLDKYKMKDGDGLWLLYTGDVGPDAYRTEKRTKKK